MNWIDVKDDLPKTNGISNFLSSYVLGYAHGHWYGDVFYNHFLKVWHKTNTQTQIEVTHWHPRIKPLNTKNQQKV